MVTLAFHRSVQLQQQGRKCNYLSHVVTTTSDIKTADFFRRLDQLPMQHPSKLYVVLPFVFQQLRVARFFHLCTKNTRQGNKSKCANHSCWKSINDSGAQCFITVSLISLLKRTSNMQSRRCNERQTISPHYSLLPYHENNKLRLP